MVRVYFNNVYIANDNGKLEDADQILLTKDPSYFLENYLVIKRFDWTRYGVSFVSIFEKITLL